MCGSRLKGSTVHWMKVHPQGMSLVKFQNTRQREDCYTGHWRFQREKSRYLQMVKIKMALDFSTATLEFKRKFSNALHRERPLA